MHRIKHKITVSSPQLTHHTIDPFVPSDFAASQSSLDLVRFLSLGIVILGLGNDTSRLGEMFLAKEVSFPEPWNRDECLMSEELGGGDREYLYQGVSYVINGMCIDSRSSSSRVNRLVSRTKQKIISQAMRLSPA